MFASSSSRSLLPVPATACWAPVPRPVTDLIEHAERIWDQQSAVGPAVVSLVHSNYYIAYHALKQQLEELNRPGLRFVELGSGCGVVANLAAQLGFESQGIELELHLCDFSRQLAMDSKLPTSFISCSYRDWEGGPCAELSVQAQAGFEALCAADVVYGYPWPAEQAYLASLVQRHCKHGARYLTYHGGRNLHLQQVHAAI